MAFVSKHRTARISPTKVRPVVNQIRRRQIDQAIMLMQMSKRRGAHFVRQVLETAKANAVQHGDLSTQDARRLMVAQVCVDQGPTIKRWRPKARGRAHPIKKRTSHITVALEAF